MNNTYMQKPIKEQKWYLVDAKKQTLGRISTYIAKILKGKHEPTYTPHNNAQIHIVIINAKYIHVTGQKQYDKKYIRHSGRPGGLKTENFKTLNQRIPERIIEHAIKGMLPKNKLGKQLFRQLNIYSNDQHPHIAQKPKIITFNL
nr:ribosomal protein L13 [Hypnea sp.]